MIRFFKYILIVLVCVLTTFKSAAQDGELDPDQLNGRDVEFNIVNYAVPFLTIAPDSRSGGMGDVGAATSPDINSQHWNAAKYAKIKEDGGISLTYTPWLRNLVNDINLLYLSGFYRMDDQQVIGGSLLYFSLGEIIFTNNEGAYQGQHTPNEFALDASYSRLFSDKWSGALAFRFIRSDLTGGGVFTSGVESKAGISFAADLSAYYETDIELDEKPAQLAFGANISNMGRKISYSVDNTQDEFIPTNLRLGSRLTMDLDEYNKISFALDLNKLMVPSTPLYNPDGDSIISGKDPDVSEALGMVQSFYDAPGGFKEEMREIMFSIGTEYWYSNQFAIRAGYFNEHQFKGNRKYFSLGVGLKLNVLTMDFAYLVPTSGRQNPLANTMRFTLSFEFSQFQ